MNNFQKNRKSLTFVGLTGHATVLIALINDPRQAPANQNTEISCLNDLYSADEVSKGAKEPTLAKPITKYTPIVHK